MANLGLEGPYTLHTSTIDNTITSTSPGNYALGYVNEKGSFIVLYVGRADKDLNARLKQWVGDTSKYKSFKASYASSPKAAFDKECQNYHDFGGSEKLDNEYHPDRPNGTDWQCPVCNIYG